jgi:hypothetical protein
MASKAKEKIVIFAWLMVVCVISILLLFWIWNDDIFNVLQVQDKTAFKTITYTFFAGVLGSVIYAFRGFYQSIVEPDNSPKSFNFKWIFWYLIRPISGGIFGFVVYALARAELVAFGLTTSISEQNNLMFFGTSFLAGFGFHDFAEFLSRKTKSLFNEKK